MRTDSSDGRQMLFGAIDSNVASTSWHTSISGSVQMYNAISGEFGLVRWRAGKDGASHRVSLLLIRSLVNV